MGEAFFVNRNVDNKHRVMKKQAADSKRLCMPDQKLKVSDYDEAEAPSPEHTAG
jgi:hypothetical protein